MYSETVHDHVGKPRNIGPPEGHTHEGTFGTPGEGPYIRIFLKISGTKIAKVGYHTYGCPAAIASASVLCEMVVGLDVKDAARIDEEQVIGALGGLPDGKRNRAAEAVAALKAALESERNA